MMIVDWRIEMVMLMLAVMYITVPSLPVSDTYATVVIVELCLEVAVIYGWLIASVVRTTRR